MNNKKLLHKPFIGAFWMFLAGACFATINTSSQYLSIHYQVHSTVIGFIQYGIALILMIPWIVNQGLKKTLKTQHLKLHLVRVLTSVIGIQLWLWALAYPVPIWQAIALVMTSPIFITIGSSLFLKESVGKSRWFATLIGIGGSLIILEPWSSDFKPASLLPIAAAFFWAIYSLMTRMMSATESAGSLVVYLLLFIAPFNLMLAVPNWDIPANNAWYLLIITGVILALAQWSIAQAYANADASFIQPFDLLKLPLNVYAGWLVFGYVPPGRLWVGALLLVGATIYILHREKNHNT